MIFHRLKNIAIDLYRNESYIIILQKDFEHSCSKSFCLRPEPEDG